MQLDTEKLKWNAMVNGKSWIVASSALETGEKGTPRPSSTKAHYRLWPTAARDPYSLLSSVY